MTAQLSHSLASASEQAAEVGSFRSFQLKLDNLDTKNFEIGSVVKKILVPAPQGMEAPKAIETPRGTGEGHRNTAHIPTSNPVCTATTCIFRSEGCASVIWVFATPQVSVGGRHSAPIPCSIDRMASRIFIFSDFYHVLYKKLWHDQL